MSKAYPEWLFVEKSNQPKKLYPVGSFFQNSGVKSKKKNPNNEDKSQKNTFDHSK